MGTDPTESAAVPTMTLAQALWHAADERLRHNLRFLEQKVSDDDLRRLQRVRISGVAYDPAQRPSVRDNEDEEWRERYHATCAAALQRLKQSLEGGELHATGIQVAPERTTDRQAIPGVWAADMHFDVESGSVRIAERRFVAVRVSQVPFNFPAVTATPSISLDDGRRPLKPEDVPALDDDTIFALLEEHANRVAKGPDAKLFPPGKISLLPLIKRRLLHRIDCNEQHATWEAEAAYLEGWIASKITSQDPTKASTIAKGLRKVYVRPKG